MNPKIERLFFQPSKTFRVDPADRGLDFDSVEFASKDETRLTGWLLRCPRAAKGTVLHLHGNAENMGAHLDLVSFLPERGYNVFMFDYRGFGRSEGVPTVEGCHWDSEAALHRLSELDGVDPGRICVFGQSLGAALAVPLAARNDRVRGLLAESAFTSYREEAAFAAGRTLAMKLAVGWAAARLVGESPLDPDKWVGKIAHCPVAFFHGVKDDVVPLRMSERLHRLAAGDKEIWPMENVGHLGGLDFFPTRYPKMVNKFFDRCLGVKESKSERAYNPYTS